MGGVGSGTKPRELSEFIDRYVDRSAGPEACWLWKGAHGPTGYGILNRPREGIYRAHRLAWVVAFGPIPEGMHVLHTCDVRDCCNPKHLYLGTHADNMIDKRKRDRAIGKPGSVHVLTEVDALDIFTLRSFGATASALSKSYQVSTSHVRNIWNGRAWGHLFGLSDPRCTPEARAEKARQRRERGRSDSKLGVKSKGVSA